MMPKPINVPVVWKYSINCAYVIIDHFLDVLDKDWQISLLFLTMQIPSFPLMVHYRSSSISRLIHCCGPISFILYSIGTITDLSATTGDHSSKIATHDEEMADIQAKLDLLTSEVRTQYRLRQKTNLLLSFLSVGKILRRYHLHLRKI